MPWSGFGEPKPIITGFRRPLNAVIMPLLEAGFVLDKLLEPLPTEEFRKADPERYAKLMREPGFICVRGKIGIDPVDRTIWSVEKDPSEIYNRSVQHCGEFYGGIYQG